MSTKEWSNIPMRNFLTIFSLLLGLVLASPVYAQDDAESSDEAGAEEMAEGEDSVDESMDEAAPEAETEAERELEGDLARLWGSRRKVKVVQRRLFPKDGKVEFTAYTATIPNDDFLVYWPVGARLGYNFTEAFTVEASFAYPFKVESDLGTFLEENASVDLNKADILETVQMYYGISVLWAPIYGKISLLGVKLTHFDAYFGGGFGIFHTNEKPEQGSQGNLGNDVVKPSANTVLGFRWFLTEKVNLRTEYRQHFFQKIDRLGGVSRPVELSIGVGLTF